MRKPTLIVLVTALAAMTAGCGILYRQPIYQGNLLEKTAIDQLQTGMSKQQVAALLGSPSIADPFHHDRWDYTTTQRVGRAGKTEIKNLTLQFQDDALTQWDGDYFAEQDEDLVRNTARQFGPNLRKDDKKRR
jgi:outer membrane protein assembly factor BamE